MRRGAGGEVTVSHHIELIVSVGIQICQGVGRSAGNAVYGVFSITALFPIECPVGFRCRAIGLPTQDGFEFAAVVFIHAEGGAEVDGRTAWRCWSHIHGEVAGMSPFGTVADIVGGIPIDKAVVEEIVEIIVGAVDTHTVVTLRSVRRNDDGGFERRVAVHSLVDPQQFVVFEPQVLIEIDPDGVNVTIIFACVGGDIDGVVGVGYDVTHEVGIVAIIRLRGGDAVRVVKVNGLLPAAESHSNDTIFVMAWDIRLAIADYKAGAHPGTVIVLAALGAHIDVVVANMGLGE